MLAREGIVRMLERTGFSVVAAVGTATERVHRTHQHHPDVVITDIRMPPECDEAGLRAAIEVRSTEPGTGVIVLSQFLDDRYAIDLVGDRPERVGYLSKEKVASPALLVDAVRRVADGGSALDPDVIAWLVGRKRVDNPLDELTPRERDVLELMAEGHSNAGIAAQLVVTVPAVERHVTGIFHKLGLDHSAAVTRHRRVLAVLRYLKQASGPAGGRDRGTEQRSSGEKETKT